MGLQGMAVHGSAAVVHVEDSASGVSVLQNRNGTLLRGRAGANCALTFALPTQTVKFGRNTGTDFRSLLRMVYVLWRARGQARPARVIVNDGPNTVCVIDVDNTYDSVDNDGSGPYGDDVETLVQRNIRHGISRWDVTDEHGNNPPVLWGIAVEVEVTFGEPGDTDPEILFTAAGADFTVPEE